MVVHRSERVILFLFLVPALALLGVFMLGPAFYAVYLSLTNKALSGLGALHTDFVGFRNYQRLFGDSDFRASIWTSLQFVFFSAIVGQFVLGFGAALLLTQRQVRWKGFFSGAILLPLVVPETVAAYTWTSLLAPDQYGTANRVIGLFGAPAVTWLQDYALQTVIVVNIWRGVAFAMILFMAALENVPNEITEAAQVDGAGALARLFLIIVPQVRYAILLYMLLTTISTFGVFGLVYVLTQGGYGTNIISIYIYHSSFQFFELGYGCAAATITLLIAMALGVFYVRALKVRV